MNESRKFSEKEFHNKLRNVSLGQRWSPELEELVRINPLWINMKYYSIERRSRMAVCKWYEENCRGRRVLDYCCGNGDDSFLMAKAEAREVIGIDISDISIENCKKRAATEKYEDVITFYVMDAEAMKFEENTFDIVSEYGALHHLDLGKAYREISRVLKPDGKCICTETLGHNPLIHLYRESTPKLRTPWEVEHILIKKDIERSKDYFKEVHILGFFYLASLAAVPFRRLPLFGALLNSLEALDSVLLSLPMLKWQAWQVVFVLERPRR